MFAHVCCSPRVAGRSRSASAFKFIWTILIKLQKRRKFGSIFVAQQSIIIIMGYYTIIDPPRRNSFLFIPSTLHSEVRAQRQRQSRASGTVGGFSVLLWDTLAGRLLEKGTEPGPFSVQGQFRWWFQPPLSPPSISLPLTCTCISDKRGKTQFGDNVPILKHGHTSCSSSRVTFCYQDFTCTVVFLT